MKLEQSFEVAAPVDRVWQALIDVEHVAPCLPGAAVTGRNEDGSYSGTFTVKIGPTTASYSGKLQMESIDEEQRTATMSAQGSDKRGQGGATAKIFSRLEEVATGRTRVDVDTDYHITGRLARFGRGGMIEDISERLLKEFAQRLAESLAGSGDGSESATAETAALAEEGGSAEAPPPTDEAAPPTDAVPPPTDAPSPSPPQAADTPPAARPIPSPALDANSLVGSIVLDRIKANPWPWIGGLFLILLLRRRRR